MQRQDNIITFGSAVPRQRNITLDISGRRIAAECRNLVVKTLPKLMNDLFENLDDSLYEMANKSENNTLQNIYFDSMRELRKQRAKIDRNFNQELLRAYDRFWETGDVTINHPSLDDLSRDTEMSLVEDEDLEDSLAITNMVSKSENRFSRELYAMGQRFSAILCAGQVDEEIAKKTPLDPGVICNAFQVAMNDVAVELPVKLVVYKLFDRHVMHYVGGLYDEINLLLGRVGVIPKLTPKVRRNPVAPSLRGEGGDSYLASDSSYVTTSSAPLSGSASQMATHEEVQAEIFSTLQHLLGMRRASSGSSMLSSSMMLSAPQSNVPLIDTGELLGVLSTLQQSNVVMLPQGRQGGTPLSAEQMRARLAQDLRIAKDGQITRSLGDADNDTIDVISMLFEFILDDYSLPDAMKALISRLQIPMLKVAIIDKSFFSKKIHPARRLLNSLAQAAVGWNDTGDRGSDTLYSRIESIIKRILNEFHDDPGLFAELDEEFTTWWQKEQRGAELAEQRTTQITRGKEQLKSAKQIVSDELNQRLLRQLVIPQAVMSILEDGWKDVMLLIYLREGSQSKDWQECLEIVDRLLWSVQPKSEYQDRQQLLRGIPELLRNLRERLNSISFDQHKMARLFKELQNCHIQVLRGGDAAQVQTSGTQPVTQHEIHFPDSQLTPDDASQLHELADEAIYENDEFAHQAKSLEPGSWLEIADGSAKVRVKLSWKSKVTDTYIFVNRKGMKAMELSASGLARHLREGTARTVDLPAEPIMDRALDAMLDALKKTSAA
ncbi:MAG: DUF1631 domain-containing protein [Candidatus Thiodiazotropha sp.]